MFLPEALVILNSEYIQINVENDMSNKGGLLLRDEIVTVDCFSAKVAQTAIKWTLFKLSTIFLIVRLFIYCLKITFKLVISLAWKFTLVISRRRVLANASLSSIYRTRWWLRFVTSIG